MPHMDVLSDTADMHTSPKFSIKSIKPNAKHEFLTTVGFDPCKIFVE